MFWPRGKKCTDTIITRIVKIITKNKYPTQSILLTTDIFNIILSCGLTRTMVFTVNYSQLKYKVIVNFLLWAMLINFKFTNIIVGQMFTVCTP